MMAPAISRMTVVLFRHGFPRACGNRFFRRASCYRFGVINGRVPERARCKRILLRLPVSLHDQIGLAAASEGVSLNQFACAVLASAVQWRSTSGQAPDSRYPKTKEELGEQIW